ncbi:MAG TPA: T9SS type A sorting domain-containing protein, partial [Bacteroidia bacterium]
SDPDRFIEMGLSIATDPSGNVFASGTYRSASSFGSTTLAPWSTHTDIFLTKIKQGHSANVIDAGISPSFSASYCSGGNVVLKAHQDSTYQYQWKVNGNSIAGATKASYEASAPGSYSVMVSNGSDSINSEPTLVTESKSVTATIEASAPVFCKDSNTVLLATTGDGYLYQWKRDGTAIRGATQASYKPDRSGDYQVRIIQGSCFDWSSTVKIEMESCGDTASAALTMPTVAESEELKEDSVMVKIYPNPNKGIFTIEVNIPDAEDLVKVELVNAMGQIVYRKIVPGTNGYINEHIELESSVPTGIYFLQLTIGNNVEKTRMMLCR